MFKTRDAENGTRNLLKVMNLSDLDPKVVVSVVNTMNQINNLNIAGLMKYQTIENTENSLY